jgi:hypothetical protein
LVLGGGRGDAAEVTVLQPIAVAFERYDLQGSVRASAKCRSVGFMGL